MTSTDLCRAIEASIAGDPGQWTITEATPSQTRTSMFGDTSATAATPARMAHAGSGIVVTLTDVPARVAVAVKSVDVPIARCDSERLAAAIEQFLIGRAVGLLFAAPSEAKTDGASVALKFSVVGFDLANFFGTAAPSTPKAEPLGPPKPSPRGDVFISGAHSWSLEPVHIRHADKTIEKSGAYKGCHCKDCQRARRGTNGK